MKSTYFALTTLASFGLTALALHPNPIMNPDSVQTVKFDQSQMSKQGTLRKTEDLGNGVKAEYWQMTAESRRRDRRSIEINCSEETEKAEKVVAMTYKSCKASCFEGTFNKPNETDCKTLWDVQNSSFGKTLVAPSGYWIFVYLGNCAVVFENTGAGNPDMTYDYGELGLVGNQLDNICSADKGYQGGACEFDGYSGALISVQSYQANHGS